MSEISLCRLPNFESIDYDICANLHEKKFSAPPNSEIQSCASNDSLNFNLNYYNYYYCPDNRYCDSDSDFKNPTRQNDQPSKPYSRNETISNTMGREHYKVKAEVNDKNAMFDTRIPGKKCKNICVPLPCQIRKEHLEFITREIPDPLWNTTYCLERIKVIITSPDLESMSERVEELWKLYLKKSPNGVYLRDIHELSKIIRYLDMEYSGLSYAYQFLGLIFKHMKKGIRVKIMSENDCNEKLRLTFDGFGRALKYGQSQVCLGILQTLVDWLDYFSDTSKPAHESFKPKCENMKSSMSQGISCTKKEWRVTDAGRLYEEEVPCSKSKKKPSQEPELEIRCVANCQVIRPKKPEKIEPMLSKSSFFGAFESSILPSILEQFMATTECDSAYCKSLVIIRRLCENSYCIRSCVMNSPIVDTCLAKLSNSDPKNEVLSRSIELLYSLLAFPSEDFNGVKIFSFPSEDSFKILIHRFMVLLISDSKVPHPLRNDVAFVIYLLALNCPPLRSAFARRLRDFASILANNILTDLNYEILLDSTIDDFEFMQYLIWTLDLVIPSSPDYFPILESYQLVPVMIRIIIGPCVLIEEAGVDSTSSEMVMRAAWKALITFANLKPLLFLQCEGAGTMLTVLKIFGASGKAPLNVVEVFLDVLKAILIRGNSGDEEYDEIMPYFCKRDAIEIFCEILVRLTSCKNFSVSMEPLICKTLLCCAEMGKYDDKQKDVFANKNGVKAVIRLIHQLLYSPAQVRHMTPVLHIMVADCIWHCIADCPTALETFLHNEGMFRLLDLLEIAASPAAQVHMAGVLVELSDYSRCADQMLFWRRRMKNTTARFAHDSDFQLPPTRGLEQISKTVSDTMGDLVEDTDLSLAAMFCELWREEEKRLNVLRTSNGEIRSLEYPLLSEYGRNYKRKIIPNRPLPATSPGAACLDLMMTIRPRIYLLVKNITEQTNTEATLFSGLGLMNQITMQIIIHFLDLKRSEIWFEIENEILAEELQLVKSDRTAMNCMLKIHRNKVAAVMDTQHYLIQRGKEQAAMNEREVYNVIRNCQLQDHLMSLREAQYYATTSDYYLLIDKKLWNKTEINDIFFSEVHKAKSIQLINSDMVRSARKGKGGSGVASSSTERRDSMPELGDFGFSLELDDYPGASFTGESPGGGVIMPTVVRSVEESPTSAEDGFYQVSPAVLFKALTKVLAQQSIWKERNVSTEQEWLVGRKWNPDWYPKALEHM